MASFDSMLRRLDENQTRHDEHQRSFEEHQRSLEELKDMMRTLLVMEGMHSPSEEHQDRVNPAPSTQEPGSNLGANSEEQNCEMVYSSTKESDATVESNEGVTGFSHCGSRDIQSKNDTAHKLLIHNYSSCHEAIEDSVTKADEDRQILCVSSREDSSPSKPEDDLRKIDATINTSTQEIVPSTVAQVGDGLFLDAHNLLEEMPMGDGSAKLQEKEFQKDETKSCSCCPVAISCEQQLAELPPPNQLLSHFGVHLDAEAKSILQGKICEVLPSSEIAIGNVKFLELEILESDGMKCGGLVRDCEKPKFHAFGVSLGSWTLDLHPQVVDGNVGSKAMEFRVLNQPFFSAQEVFVKMSKKECADFELSSTVEDAFGSIDSPSSFVFDPGIAYIVVVSFRQSCLHMVW